MSTPPPPSSPSSSDATPPPFWPGVRADASTRNPFHRAIDSPDLETITHLRHTLRTPLNQIIGYSEMLMESMTEGGDTALMRDVKKIHTAGGQLLALFNDTLAPWKVESGKIDLLAMSHEMRSPLNVIVGYSELCQEEAAGHGHPEFVEDLKKIRLAANNLHQLVDHREFPAKIEIGDSVANLGLAADIMLGQTGLHTATTPPLDLGEAAPRAAGRLLIVEDDPLNREMLSRRLQRLGYSVAHAENGRVALDILKNQPFDLVLLDIIMPEMNGFQTIEFMKTDPKLRYVPVIMITALDEVDSTVRCLEAGAEDYVPKPFNPIILRARINASLEKKWLRDQEQAHLTQLQAERSKSERLLLNILPKAIADRLKQGERVIVDSFREATVLFADIAGFTRIAATMAPSRMVQLLNDIFSSFDRLVEARGLEKIKTIGDSYMVVGGVPTPLPNHAEACADLALEMLDAVAGFNRRHQLSWELRIGINSGPVTAGIIGTRKFAYDLWGDTVNIASRMESHGQVGRIQVSPGTQLLLAGKFDFEERGSVDVKGVGPMATFHLLGRKK